MAWTRQAGMRLAPLGGATRNFYLERLPKIRLSSNLASAAYTSSLPHLPFNDGTSSTSTTPKALSPLDRARLESMLRVDHAGEVAANTIYSAQKTAFEWVGNKATAKMCQEMWETEKKHLGVTKQLLDQHRVRPSFLMPAWSIAGSMLGGATALMGKEAAMACTEAVETVIGEHYDDQLDHLVSMTKSLQGQDSSLDLLRRVITEFRDDELEHLDTAVEHDAQQAPAHALLSAIIGFGCKGAIRIAKRL